MGTPGDEDEQISVPNGSVVALLRRAAPNQTLLVSDEAVDDGVRVRRLRFFQPDEDDAGGSGEELVSDHVQTEMKLRSDNSVDGACLRQHYHCLMVAALSCPAKSGQVQSVAVLGHGAGALSSFLEHVIGATVTAVDSDPAVIQMGKRYFGQHAKHVHVCDAADFVLQHHADSSFDAVLVDINTYREPLAAPPACILPPHVVRALARITDLVVVNVLGGGEADRHHVAAAFAACFPKQHVSWLRSPHCSNHILVAGWELDQPQQAHLDAWVALQRRPRELSRALASVRFDDASIACALPFVRRSRRDGEEQELSEDADGTLERAQADSGSPSSVAGGPGKPARRVCARAEEGDAAMARSKKRRGRGGGWEALSF